MDNHKTAIKNFHLGEFYYFGRVFKQEPSKAFAYFSQVVLSDDLSRRHKAHLYLGVCYYLGLAPLKNIELGIEHLEKAVLSGDEKIKGQAHLYLEKCYFFTDAQHDFNKGDEHFSQAILSKQPWIKDAAFFYYGKYYYSICFDKGIGKKIGMSKYLAKELAIRYLSQAALSADVLISDRAHFYIAECYYSLSDTQDAFNKAFEHFKKVSFSHNSWIRDRANYYCGVCCYEGYGVLVNHLKALIYFEIASISETTDIKLEADRYIKMIESSTVVQSGVKNIIGTHDEEKQRCVVL